MGSSVKHVKKIVILMGFLVLYFVLFGLLFGWHRLHGDWGPLDQSVDGPNLYVSFVWLPIALVGGTSCPISDTNRCSRPSGSSSRSTRRSSTRGWKPTTSP